MDLENFDLKGSINLPKTSFSMKANLPQAEPKMLARWEAEDLYGQIRAARVARKEHIFEPARSFFVSAVSDCGARSAQMQPRELK